MPEVADELFRVFREVAPEVIGRKKSRRLLQAMLGYIVMQIPSNGVGPVIGVRKQAAQFLSDGLNTLKQEEGE
jgi:hypothetical protein